MQRDLNLHNTKLQELVRQNTEELDFAYQHLQKLDTVKGEFLEMIAHELRTPLNGILTAGEIIFDYDSENQDLIDLKEIYQQSKKRILSLVEDALLINRLDSSTSGVGSETYPLEELLKMVEDFGEIPDALFSKGKPAQDILESVILCNSKLMGNAIMDMYLLAWKLSTDAEYPEITYRLVDNALFRHLKAK